MEEIEAMKRKRIIKVRVQIGKKEISFAAKDLGQAQYLLLSAIEKLIPGHVDEWLEKHKLLKKK